MPIGRSTDPGVIARKIQEINSRNPIISLAFDRWRIEDLKRELDAIGCRVPLEGFGQGYKDMTPRGRCGRAPGRPGAVTPRRPPGA